MILLFLPAKALHPIARSLSYHKSDAHALEGSTFSHISNCPSQNCFLDPPLNRKLRVLWFGRITSSRDPACVLTQRIGCCHRLHFCRPHQRVRAFRDIITLRLDGNQPAAGRPDNLIFSYYERVKKSTTHGVIARIGKFVLKRIRPPGGKLINIENENGLGTRIENKRTFLSKQRSLIAHGNKNNQLSDRAVGLLSARAISRSRNYIFLFKYRRLWFSCCRLHPVRLAGRSKCILNDRRWYSSVPICGCSHFSIHCQPRYWNLKSFPEWGCIDEVNIIRLREQLSFWLYLKAYWRFAGDVEHSWIADSWTWRSRVWEL